ncbi:tetratricopeptide repeat protein [Sorangium sp. So ce590]|uniref:tetratricopeptide repeat protein n=1 Tax=Sorangium sp. So ce590 TaxID=3133317 RepID=UPI003F606F84
MEQLWQRVSEGRHTALLDIVPGEPPPQLGLRVLRVRCDVPEVTLGPLHEVRTQVERLVGGAPPLLDQARSRVVSGLRRRLLGDVHERRVDVEFTEAANRLAQHTDRRWAIVFDAVELADHATLDVLRRVVSRPDALRVALVLSFRLRAPAGPAGELLSAVRAGSGADAILRPPDATTTLTSVTAPPPPPQLTLRELPGEVLRVLRAGAIVGSGFEGELVAALLRVDAVDVLEALQRAADAGVPLEDRGEGRFHLPQTIVEALRGSILPSLARLWHRRLATLLSEEPIAPGAPAAYDPRAAAGAVAPDPQKSPAAGPAGASSAPSTSTPAIATPRTSGTMPPPAAASPGAPTAAAVQVLESGGAAAADEREKGADAGSLGARGGVPPVAETLRPPPAAAHAGGAHMNSARRAYPRVGQERSTPIAPAGPGNPPWPYAELFPRSPESRRRSEPPESVRFDAPPDSLDAPIPGPVRVPRDLAPGSAGGQGDEPILSVRGASLRVPAALSERPPPGGSRSSFPWPAAPDAAASARVDPARAAAESLRAAAPLGVSVHPAPPEPDRAEAASAAGASEHGAGRRPHDARAAAHLTEAGDLEEAARRYRGAAAEAAAMGAYAQALSYGRKALALLDGMPATPARRRLRVGALAGLARVQWQAAGPDPDFTLAGALEVLDAARALLAQGDPPELHAEVAALTASVCYDIGDMRSLERALEELTTASRLLLDAGDALGSARLLNDQAAVYVRMGDPVRAAHLLTESRRVFEERARVDPVARVELAETDHLFARIPLHVPPRPGRESDALSLGIDHALAAERTYKQLGDGRELARVWETIGRLELRKGRLDRATQRLSAAIEAEEALGDLIGLARSTAALAEVLSAKGLHREALSLLAESMAMNLEKGSPLGLAYNRRALNALVPNISLQGDEAELLRKLAAQLTAAEAALGRLRLPGEPD